MKSLRLCSSGQLGAPGWEANMASWRRTNRGPHRLGWRLWKDLQDLTVNILRQAGKGRVPGDPPTDTCLGRAVKGSETADDGLAAARPALRGSRKRCYGDSQPCRPARRAYPIARTPAMRNFASCVLCASPCFPNFLEWMCMT